MVFLSFTGRGQRSVSCAQVKLKAENDRQSPSPSALYFAPDVAAREEEQRRRAHELYREQIALVEQRKREAILKRFEEQKQEEDMLHRNKHELVEISLSVTLFGRICVVLTRSLFGAH